MNLASLLEILWNIKDRLLEMCSVSTNGERASPAQQQGSQLIGCYYLLITLVDKNAHILVQSLPNFQELVHVSVHMYSYLSWLLA